MPSLPQDLTRARSPFGESGAYSNEKEGHILNRALTAIAILSATCFMGLSSVQAGTYNTRPLVPEALVKGDAWAVVRPRLEVDALIALDRLPPWL